jgi:hypothetical protein
MQSCHQAVFRPQARFWRDQFLPDGGLPFSDTLAEDIIAQSLTAIKTCWLDRIYSPLLTLGVWLMRPNRCWGSVSQGRSKWSPHISPTSAASSDDERLATSTLTRWRAPSSPHEPGVFLGPVLSADHSCRAAVARLIAHRVSRGQAPCSSETGAYCQARTRLPEEFFSNVARQTGRALEKRIDPQGLWKSCRVLASDGSSVARPDPLANQREYPQPDTQKPGLGFPLARLAAVFSLACGAVRDVGIGRYAGKGQSELGMLRK